MSLCFVGTSHAARTLAQAAVFKGFVITNHVEGAHLVFVSEDTPTDETGKRDLAPIRKLIDETVPRAKCPVIVSSQVTPGFMRSLGMPIYHMAETLRIKDAMERALNPEQIILGCPDFDSYIPQVILDYCNAFDCPVVRMSYESAEMAKIAINVFLAAQVDATNRLAAAAAKIGAQWRDVANVLRHDKRIGQFAYLTPGRWQDSRHLLRDAYWLASLDNYGPDQ